MIVIFLIRVTLKTLYIMLEECERVFIYCYFIEIDTDRLQFHTRKNTAKAIGTSEKYG